MVLIIWVN